MRTIVYWAVFVLNVQVQPDLEELATNMEDNEGTEEKEEVNLGKLQFSMDYDFQKSEVRDYCCLIFISKIVFWIAVCLVCWLQMCISFVAVSEWVVS